jgi:hypothetical protein
MPCPVDRWSEWSEWSEWSTYCILCTCIHPLSTE